MTDIHGYHQPHCHLELTDKEQKVIAAFEEARPGLGAIAEQNIRTSTTGLREIVADMDESEIVCREGINSNNGFTYRHIGPDGGVMKGIEFNPNLVPVVTGLTLAVSCEWDKEKILEICADALTDTNAHVEARQLREMLERVKREG